MVFTCSRSSSAMLRNTSYSELRGTTQSSHAQADSHELFDRMLPEHAKQRAARHARSSHTHALLDIVQLGRRQAWDPTDLHRHLRNGSPGYKCYKINKRTSFI